MHLFTLFTFTFNQNRREFPTHCFLKEATICMQYETKIKLKIHYVSCLLFNLDALCEAYALSLPGVI